MREIAASETERRKKDEQETRIIRQRVGPEIDLSEYGGKQFRQVKIHYASRFKRREGDRVEFVSMKEEAKRSKGIKPIKPLRFTSGVLCNIIQMITDPEKILDPSMTIS